MKIGRWEDVRRCWKELKTWRRWQKRFKDEGGYKKVYRGTDLAARKVLEASVTEKNGSSTESPFFWSHFASIPCTSHWWNNPSRGPNTLIHRLVTNVQETQTGDVFQHRPVPSLHRLHSVQQQWSIGISHWKARQFNVLSLAHGGQTTCKSGRVLLRMKETHWSILNQVIDKIRNQHKSWPSSFQCAYLAV